MYKTFKYPDELARKKSCSFQLHKKARIWTVEYALKPPFSALFTHLNLLRPTAPAKPTSKETTPISQIQLEFCALTCYSTFWPLIITYILYFIISACPLAIKFVKDQDSFIQAYIPQNT